MRIAQNLWEAIVDDPANAPLVTIRLRDEQRCLQFAAQLVAAARADFMATYRYLQRLRGPQGRVARALGEETLRSLIVEGLQ